MWNCIKAARQWKSQFSFQFCSLLSEKFGNEQMQLLRRLLIAFCAVMQQSWSWEETGVRAAGRSLMSFPAWTAYKGQTPMLGEESAATWKDLLILCTLLCTFLTVPFHSSLNMCPKWLKICTMGTESIQNPLHFSLFVPLQPFAKII